MQQFCFAFVLVLASFREFEDENEEDDEDDLIPRDTFDRSYAEFGVPRLRGSGPEAATMQ